VMTQNADVIDATTTFLQRLGVTEIRVDQTRGVGRGISGTRHVSPVEELCGKCWEGRLCVTPTGDMYPCVFSRSWRVGTVADGVRNVIHGDRLTTFRSMLKLRVQNTSQSCGPQCGPDCGPATCGPQCSP
jgi:radical SAM protein with 4Fe4S-binding SPASM domain